MTIPRYKLPRWNGSECVCDCGDEPPPIECDIEVENEWTWLQSAAFPLSYTNSGSANIPTNSILFPINSASPLINSQIVSAGSYLQINLAQENGSGIIPVTLDWSRYWEIKFERYRTAYDQSEFIAIFGNNPNLDRIIFCYENYSSSRIKASSIDLIQDISQTLNSQPIGIGILNQWFEGYIRWDNNNKKFLYRIEETEICLGLENPPTGYAGVCLALYQNVAPRDMRIRNIQITNY
jgi:hypothetical protein